MDLHDARILARSLLDEHGLTGWRVSFDRAKSRAGICRYSDRVIGLSAPITRLHSEAEVRDTILHEVAHALAGPAAGHGPRWKAVARRIGSSGERCVSSSSPRVHGAWVGVCPQGHTADRHRRPDRVLLCRPCGSRPTLERVFSWSHHGRPVPPAHIHPTYASELAALSRGARLQRLGLGVKARVVAPGPLHGQVGRVMKVGRTRYHVRLPGGTYTVPFGLVEPVARVPDRSG
jgi:predicted SprT family Zn-dependent metalloprotease